MQPTSTTPGNAAPPLPRPEKRHVQETFWVERSAGSPPKESQARCLSSLAGKSRADSPMARLPCTRFDPIRLIKATLVGNHALTSVLPCQEA